MQSLNELVKKYFPNEEIIREANVMLQDTWKGRVARFPISFSKYFYKKPLPMIETDQKFYFDRRVALIERSIMQIFKSPLIALVFITFFYIFTDVTLTLQNYLVITILIIFTGLLNILLNRSSIENILTIEKAWIDEGTKVSGKTVLKGLIPKGYEKNYFFYSHIPKEKRKGWHLRLANTRVPYDMDFKIEFTETNLK
jgi:hypothetical protein